MFALIITLWMITGYWSPYLFHGLAAFLYMFKVDTMFVNLWISVPIDMIIFGRLAIKLMYMKCLYGNKKKIGKVANDLHVIIREIENKDMGGVYRMLLVSTLTYLGISVTPAFIVYSWISLTSIFMQLVGLNYQLTFKYYAYPIFVLSVIYNGGYNFIDIIASVIIHGLNMMIEFQLI